LWDDNEEHGQPVPDFQESRTTTASEPSSLTSVEPGPFDPSELRGGRGTELPQQYDQSELWDNWVSGVRNPLGGSGGDHTNPQSHLGGIGVGFDPDFGSSGDDERGYNSKERQNNWGDPRTSLIATFPYPCARDALGDTESYLPTNILADHRHARPPRKNKGGMVECVFGYPLASLSLI